MSDDRKKEIIERTIRLMNVRPSSTDETENFNGISHEDLCKAIEDWLYQCKIIFGEPIWILKTQALNDSGVDLALDLKRCSTRIGFQVKSYGDIKNKDFHSKVLMQITQSKKHSLDFFFITFAGNMNDPSMIQKVGIIINEIHQLKDPYIFVIPPEKLYTIYRNYIDRGHPLAFVDFSYHDLILMIKGISETLTNEERKVSVSVNFENKIPDQQNYPYKIETILAIPEEHSDLFDKLAEIHTTGEPVTIPGEYFKKFIVLNKEQIVSDKIPKFVLIKPEYPQFVINLQILDDNQYVIKELADYKFERHEEKDKVVWIPVDKSLPIQLELNFRILNLINGEFEIGMNIKLDISKSNSIKIFEAIEFLLSLNIGKKLKISNSEFNSEIPISSEIKFQINETDYYLFEALSFIQQKTGILLKIPPHISKEEISNIQTIASHLFLGRVILSSFSLNYEKIPRLEGLKLIEEFETNGRIKVVLQQRYKVQIFNTEIDLGPFVPTEINEMKPIGDLQSLKEQFLNPNYDNVTLDLEFFGKPMEVPLLWFQKRIIEN